jgi:biopolymer transport protein TolR
VPKVQPSTSSSGGRRSRGRRTSTALAEINVIPLVDVMLVLLIIFMVTAPMLQRGIEVNLPVSSRSQDIAAERMFVDIPASYRTDRRVFINKEPIGVAVLAERLRQMMLTRSDKQVFVRTDGQLTVQDIVDVFGSLKEAGVQTAGLVTEMPTTR